MSITHPWDETSVDLAKMTEIENLRKNHVFEEVPFVGQPRVSTRWVLTEKFVDGKRIIQAMKKNSFGKLILPLAVKNAWASSGQYLHLKIGKVIL